MANYFWDASALVKYFVTEPGSTWVRHLLDSQDTVTTSPLHVVLVAEITRVEVAAGIVALLQNRALALVRQSLIFVSGDKTLLTAAQAEGLLTDNPFDHVSPLDTPQASNTI